MILQEACKPPRSLTCPYGATASQTSQTHWGLWPPSPQWAFICFRWGYGAPTMLLPPHLWDRIWKISWNHGSLLGVKWYHHAVVEALIPHGMIPTLKGDCQTIYAVDGDMEPSSCCYHHTCGTRFGSQVKLWISAGCQMIPSCSGWGSHPAWNDSHIHSKHIQGDWQALYAVDGDMEPPPCCYHHTCGTGFEKSAEKSWITAGCQMIPSCSGWDSHPTWNNSHIHFEYVYAVDGDMEPPSCCYHHTCGTRFESQLKSWITAGCQMIPSCSGWGSHPTWNDSHIHSKHIKGRYWQILYAVDGDMEPPPCCYHHTCGTGFGKLAKKSWITAGCQKLYRVRVHSYAQHIYHWKVLTHLICPIWM
jgi:hypothetical protein